VAKVRRHGQGSIWTEKRARGRVFVGQVSVNGRLYQRVLGVERRAGEKDGLTRAMAEARLREVRREIEADAGARSDLTLREAGERYLAHIEARRNLKRATLQDYWLYLRRHLTGPQSPTRRGTRPVRSEPFFEDRRLASITKADVNRYVDAKTAEGLAPRTLDAHLTLLSAVCRYAVEQAWATSNPVVAVERPRPDDPDEVTDGPRRAHTVEQVAAVLRACDDFERCLFATAYYTGMRLGELIALKWRDVDLVHSIVHVRRSWSRGAETTTKSRKRRIVALAPTVAQAFAHHAAFTNYGAPDDRVFAHPESGRVLDEGSVRSRFISAQTSAEVPVYKMHDTRSTFATVLWSRGESISTIQATLGHADVRTTMGYIVGYHVSGDEGASIEHAFSEGAELEPRTH
jgi:integrase